MKRGSKRKGKGCPRCAELEVRVRDQARIINEQQRVIRQLEERIRELEERLSLTSQNSSIPPSRNPLNAPQPSGKKRSGRRRGGQPGHKGTCRELVPIEEVDELISHVPTCCESCRKPLPQKPRADDPSPRRHQVTELNEKPWTITEHQTHARTCSCGTTTWAELPAEYRSSFGPRLVALLATLTGAMKVSRRSTQEFIQDVLGIPISLGAVSELEQEVSESLAEAYEVAGEAVRDAPKKNVDETGWKQAGQRRWLWVAATATLAFFAIHQRRGKEGFAALLSEVKGLITTDRWHVYATIKNRCRQICWAHLKRDFRRLSERSGEAGQLGDRALTITGFVFYLWRDFKTRQIDRATLNQCLRPLKAEMREILERGVELDLKKVSKFCANLLALEPALWNFTRYEDLEPTNNHAERIIRPAVIWRKCSFGCDSDRGCRYVERMLTVAQSCRLQHRRVYQFLVDSLVAQRTGSVPPSILPATA